MKISHSRQRPNRQILEEASTWFVDFRVGDVDAGAREEFHQWLRRSPEHIQAYLEIAGTYAELPPPNVDGCFDTTALIAHARSSADVNVISLGPHRSEAHGGAPAAGGRSGRTRLALAATVLITITAGFGAWNQFFRGTYSTVIGEQRSLTLADGSTVELNAHSRIRVRYSEHERHIDLLEGQALFHVAGNKARPFIVRSGATEVRAVGTQFDVYRRPSATIVTVVEGRVVVLPPPVPTESQSMPPALERGNGARGEDETGSARAPAAGADRGEVFLSAGEQLTVTPKAARKEDHPDIVAATAWTTRQLIFDATPLAEVAEQFNRYNTRQLVVDGGGLADFHVSGNYSSNNPDSLLRFLRAQPGIELIETQREIRVVLK